MFGMGTGGSLRLLSPERSRAPALRCRLERSAFQHSRCRLPSLASRQYNCLPASLSGFSFPASGFDTMCLAPSKPHRLDCFAPPTKIRSFNPQHSLAFRSRFRLFSHNLLLGFGPGLRFGSLRSLSLASSLLLPTAFSLLPLSKIKPSTD